MTSINAVGKKLVFCCKVKKDLNIQPFLAFHFNTCVNSRVHQIKIRENEGL